MLFRGYNDSRTHLDIMLYIHCQHNLQRKIVKENNTNTKETNIYFFLDFNWRREGGLIVPTQLLHSSYQLLIIFLRMLLKTELNFWASRQIACYNRSPFQNSTLVQKSRVPDLHFNNQHMSPNGLFTTHHRVLQGPLYVCVDGVREGRYAGA